MNKLGSIALLSSLFAANASFAAQSLEATVDGMVCAFCAQGIETKLRELPQTRAVYVNLEKRLVAVEIKEGTSLAPEKVRELVTDAGYDVAKIQVVSKSVAQIKAETSKKK